MKSMWQILGVPRTAREKKQVVAEDCFLLRGFWRLLKKLLKKRRMPEEDFLRHSSSIKKDLKNDMD